MGGTLAVLYGTWIVQCACMSRYRKVWFLSTCTYVYPHSKDGILIIQDALIKQVIMK